mmetsp:Transcript_148153/g.475839  ORF Transcript_148153/g.475839 Transcript_148153/m.475839 type:complete len:201 (+) Transcript_148153:97-699(+)|eukprot:CAMPEP_0203955268 /NCGR_PEP_ID=MMETSP0359-20131031/87960_1 /ASSEMBLY_ACC=CAM_ASM_000338 /TAXON_ID=268821 /ORGANISM="Scrippsiella Hangoei, Strain SHTV-5" /LENGTH=200 /DNA_ID=CAMNT_0050888869 /DNA_START=77 /DNA_END=679 /DNA_ORIENTATION=-
MKISVALASGRLLLRGVDLQSDATVGSLQHMAEASMGRPLYPLLAPGGASLDELQATLDSCRLGDGDVLNAVVRPLIEFGAASGEVAGYLAFWAVADGVEVILIRGDGHTLASEVLSASDNAGIHHHGRLGYMFSWSGGVDLDGDEMSGRHGPSWRLEARRGAFTDAWQIRHDISHDEDSQNYFWGPHTSGKWLHEMLAA